MRPSLSKLRMIGKPAASIAAIFVLVAGLAAGCSPMKTIRNAGRSVSQMAWSGDDLNKRIGFVAFANQSAFGGPSLAKFFQERLSEQLTDICPDQKLAQGSGAMDSLPRLDNGAVDNLALAEAGRFLGLNAVVTGAVIGVRTFQRSEGWFWFKSPHHYVQVQVATDVYDTLTGAKLLYESVSQEVEIEAYQQDSIETGKVNKSEDVEIALAQLAETAAEKICDSLAEVPWIGYVTAASEAGAILSTGAEAGLEEGQVFDILAASKLYTGKGGQEYFVPGLPKGQIRITAVYPDKAEAEPVSGEKPVVGDAIRLAQ